MDVSNLLSYDAPQHTRPQQGSEVTQSEQQRSHQYPTRRSLSSNNQSQSDQRYGVSPPSHLYGMGNQGIQSNYDLSPAVPIPKNVTFELLFDGETQYRARLPMRVQIFPHDTTDSIVTTVKNFYGLYEGATKGVSFEDERGNTLIARHENFKNHMVIYVRVIPDYSQPSHSHAQPGYNSASPISANRVSHQLEESPRMLPPHPAQILNYGQPSSRPASRVANKRSASPRSKSRRSESAHKGHARSGIKAREASAHGSFDDLNSDAINGYSSGDGGAGSVTSSRKARNEQLASAEISLDNILEGGRRKRAKFESSVSLAQSRSLCFVLPLIHDLCIGTTFICAASSASTKFHLLNLASETDKSSGQPLSFRQTSTASLRVQPVTSVSTELWAQ